MKLKNISEEKVLERRFKILWNILWPIPSVEWKFFQIPCWEKTKSILKNTNRIQREHEVLALYIKVYCLGTWQIFFGTLFQKVSHLSRAFVPLWGRGENFFGKPGDLLHFRTFLKDLIYTRYTDFQLIFISKCGEFRVVFSKTP